VRARSSARAAAIDELYFKSFLREDLGDAVAHRPRADHSTRLMFSMRRREYQKDWKDSVEGGAKEDASEHREASHAPTFRRRRFGEVLAVAVRRRRTERAVEAARERACRGVRGGSPSDNCDQRSTASATPLPPPRHNAAMPRLSRRR